MKAYEIDTYLRKIAPWELAIPGDELGFIIGDPNKNVKKIGVTLRPTIYVLERAVSENVDMLITHEAFLYSQKKELFLEKPILVKIPNMRRLAIVFKNNLIVYRMHTNWDEASGGNNDTLARLLGMNVIKKIPCGRIGTVPPMTLREFSKLVKVKLKCDRVIVVGDKNAKISKVASVSGSGNSFLGNIELAYEENVHVYVSGDIKDSVARYAVDLGLSIIDAGHYATEMHGMKALTDKIRGHFKELEVLFFDVKKPWSYE